MEVPRHWRMKKQRYTLTGEICLNCNTPMFPPRAVCPHCGGDAKHVFAVQPQPAFALEERVQSAGK